MVASLCLVLVKVLKPKVKRFIEDYPFPYYLILDDIQALPVTNLENTTAGYGAQFGMKEIERRTTPHHMVLLERDHVRIGFAMNGKDASQDGAAILVNGIHPLREELKAKGVSVSEIQTDEREGKKYEAFFVVAPDGLCYYFHEQIQ